MEHTEDTRQAEEPAAPRKRFRYRPPRTTAEGEREEIAAALGSFLDGMKPDDQRFLCDHVRWVRAGLQGPPLAETARMLEVDLDCFSLILAREVIRRRGVPEGWAVEHAMRERVKDAIRAAQQGRYTRLLDLVPELLAPLAVIHYQAN